MTYWSLGVSPVGGYGGGLGSLWDRFLLRCRSPTVRGLVLLVSDKDHRCRRQWTIPPTTVDFLVVQPDPDGPAPSTPPSGDAPTSRLTPARRLYVVPVEEAQQIQFFHTLVFQMVRRTETDPGDRGVVDGSPTVDGRRTTRTEGRGSTGSGGMGLGTCLDGRDVGEEDGSGPVGSVGEEGRSVSLWTGGGGVDGDGGGGVPPRGSYPRDEGWTHLPPGDVKGPVGGLCLGDVAPRCGSGRSWDPLGRARRGRVSNVGDRILSFRRTESRRHRTRTVRRRVGRKVGGLGRVRSSVDRDGWGRGPDLYPDGLTSVSPAP